MEREYLSDLTVAAGAQKPKQSVSASAMPGAPTILLRPQVLQLLEITTALYTRQLFNHTYAMRYLLKERGLTRRTIQEMRLGLAYRDTLVDELDRLDIPCSLAEEAGLLMPGGIGEFLHHRVVFPIIDEADAPVFMIGRTLNERVEPKYLNLPNTDLLSRQPMIFGAAKLGCIVVEGAMDAAALRQWGLHHEYLVIALLGVGHHAIIEYSLSHAGGKPIYLSLDQDNAGKQASLQLAETLSAKGIQARVLVDRDRYNTALALTRRLQTFSLRGAPNQIEKRIAAAQQHIELVVWLESHRWIRWVHWRGVKDAGALLPEQGRGRAMFVAALQLKDSAEYFSSLLAKEF